MSPGNRSHSDMCVQEDGEWGRRKDTSYGDNLKNCRYNDTKDDSNAYSYERCVFEACIHALNYRLLWLFYMYRGVLDFFYNIV